MQQSEGSFAVVCVSGNDGSGLEYLPTLLIVNKKNKILYHVQNTFTND